MKNTTMELLEVFESLGIYVDDMELDIKLEIDSIEFISLIIAIEEKYDINIPDEYLLFDKLNTIRDFISVIDSLRNEE